MNYLLLLTRTLLTATHWLAHWRARSAECAFKDAAEKTAALLRDHERKLGNANSRTPLVALREQAALARSADLEASLEASFSRWNGFATRLGQWRRAVAGFQARWLVVVAMGLTDFFLTGHGLSMLEANFPERAQQVSTWAEKATFSRQQKQAPVELVSEQVD